MSVPNIPPSSAELGVIFDMDGVLVDSTAAHFEAFHEFGKRIGVPFTRDFFLRIFGLHNDEIFPLWLGNQLTREEVTRFASEKEALYRELAPHHVRPVNGVLALIDSLANAGFHLAVGSSGPRQNVELAMEVTGRRSLFSTTVSGDDVQRGKPAPDIFLKAAIGLGLRPDQCVVIEDALAGIAAAHAAEMKVIGIATSLPIQSLGGANLAVQTMSELNPLVIRKLLTP
ncbi:MAG: hypothetical protein A2X94_07790 [Bdellovibrionales bacterium GWB1_55_8]|nr:MAG: hypothetical protein A2X94_07790 [Bdellovibrionales bacterium GWB1_55_8]